MRLRRSCTVSVSSRRAHVRILQPRRSCSAGTRRRPPNPIADPIAASAPRSARRRPSLARTAAQRTAQRAKAERTAARAGSRRATRSTTGRHPRAGSSRRPSRQPARAMTPRAGDERRRGVVARRDGAEHASRVRSPSLCDVPRNCEMSKSVAQRVACSGDWAAKVCSAIELRHWVPTSRESQRDTRAKHSLERDAKHGRGVRRGAEDDDAPSRTVRSPCRRCMSVSEVR